MATDFAITATDAVTHALREIKVLASGEEPTAEELEDGLFILNSMLKSWQAEGVNLWREDDRSITITAATASVTLADDIRQVFSARFIGSDYERVLGQWEREDYLSLPVKDTVGDPTIFYVSRQKDALVAYFWPVPSADSTVKLDCERIVDTVEASDLIDVPNAWNETVWICLAARCGSFGGDGRALDRATERAGVLYSRLLDDDRPQSVFLGAG